MAEVFPHLVDLIPHRGPALLLDQVVAHDDTETECTARIGSEMQYVASGRADAALAMELIAQAVAVHVGLQNRWSGGAPRAGYVVGVPRMKFYGGDYCVGDVLSVRVHLDFHEGSVGRFDGVVRSGDVTRAEGTVTVFEPPLAEQPASGDDGSDGG